MSIPLRVLVPNPDIPGTMLVPMTKGYFAIVDSADAGFVGQFNWSAVVKPHAIYAASRPRGKGIYLHRELWAHWGMPESRMIDHINRNGLDNRRINLRAATDTQNQWNRVATRSNPIGLKGAYWHKGNRRWHSSIKVHGKEIGLGCFDTPEEAHAAYARAAREYFGEFARVA